MLTALAVAIAVWFGQLRLKRAGLPVESFSSIILWGIVGGLIGARLFHIGDHLPYYVSHPLEAFAVYEGGLAAYGAFIGGILGGCIAARRAGQSIWRLLDAAAPALLVGQAIGRLGCLSNGDAWGIPTGGAWGIVYGHPNALLPSGLLGVPTHPYPVYEIAAVLVLLGGLWLTGRWLAAPGSISLVAAMGYGAVRFGLGFFRQETVLFLGLQEEQLVAVATAFAALSMLFIRLRAST